MLQKKLVDIITSSAFVIIVCLTSFIIMIQGCSVADSRPPLMWSFDTNMDAINDSRQLHIERHADASDGSSQ